MAEKDSELSVEGSKAIDALELDKKQLYTKAAMKQLLSMNPPKDIVKFHEYGKFEYLPITAVERILDGLFSTWTVEIKREGVAVNGFYVVVKLRAQIPQSDDWLEADGIGFAEFQTSKGSSPTDFTNLMPATGTMMIPKAKAEAIKNAAKTFGNLFGRNLARNDDRQEAEQTTVNKGRQKIQDALKGKENETN